MNEGDSLHGENVFRDRNVTKKDWPLPWVLIAWREDALGDDSVPAGRGGCRHRLRNPTGPWTGGGSPVPCPIQSPHMSLPTQPLSTPSCPNGVFLATGNSCGEGSSSELLRSFQFPFLATVSSSSTCALPEIHLRYNCFFPEVS